MSMASFKEVPCAWKVLLRWDTSSFYSTQLRGNLSNKQEVMCQNNSLVTQVGFVDYPKLLLASFCSQADKSVWLEQQHEWAGLRHIYDSPASLITNGVITPSLWDTGYTEHPAFSPFTFLGLSSISTRAPLYSRMLTDPKRSQTRKVSKRTKKWCLSISKVF